MQKNINQTAIFNFTESFEKKLVNLYKQLQDSGCTYLYYTVNDSSKGRIRFCTNDDWMNCYLEDGLINNDPIKINCEQNKNRILTWNNLPILGLAQNKVMQARESFKIYNGISFIRHNPINGLQKILAVCTDSKSHDFSRKIFSDDYKLKNILFDIFDYC